MTAKRIARGEAGSITIASSGASSYGFLPRLVTLATAEMHDVDLVLLEMVTTAQVEALAANRLDLGLVRMPIDRRGLGIICVQREPLMVAVPKNHPLADGRQPTVRDLDRQDFIMYSPSEGRYFHDLVTSVLRAAEVMPNFVQYIHQIHTILALVGVGMGIALVPESAQALNFDGVVLRTLRLSPKAFAELHLVWRRSNDNPALHRFRDLVTHKFLENSP